MPPQSHDKRIFTPRGLLRDLGVLISNAGRIRRAMKGPTIGRAMISKIMMVVTAVNGCTYPARDLLPLV